MMRDMLELYGETSDTEVEPTKEELEALYPDNEIQFVAGRKNECPAPSCKHFKPNTYANLFRKVRPILNMGLCWRSAMVRAMKVVDLYFATSHSFEKIQSLSMTPEYYTKFRAVYDFMVEYGIICPIFPEKTMTHR